MAPLHFRIPRCLIISYVDDFTISGGSLSYRGNIRRLHELFEKLETRACCLGISFSVPKTELIHWRTTSQRLPEVCLSNPNQGGNFPPLRLRPMAWVLVDSGP